MTIHHIKRSINAIETVVMETKVSNLLIYVEKQNPQRNYICANVNKRRLFINGYTERCAIGTPQKIRRRHQRNIY